MREKKYLILFFYILTIFYIQQSIGCCFSCCDDCCLDATNQEKLSIKDKKLINDLISEVTKKFEKYRETFKKIKADRKIEEYQNEPKLSDNINNIFELYQLAKRNKLEKIANSIYSEYKIEQKTFIEYSSKLGLAKKLKGELFDIDIHS